jgi:hypothetical protein
MRSSCCPSAASGTRSTGSKFNRVSVFCGNYVCT